MSFAEVIVIALATALTGGLAVLGSVLHHRRKGSSPQTPPPHRPASTRALVIATVSVIAAPAVGWALAPAWMTYIGTMVPNAVIVTDVTEPIRTRLYGTALLACGAALPGLAVIGWLLLSSRRSIRGAAIFATATSVFFTAGAMMGVSLVPGAFPAQTGATLAADGPDLQLRLIDVMRQTVETALGFGFGGGSFAAVWVVAASSARGLRGALLASVTLPFVAASVAALVTPPDVVSQLLMAFAISACWMMGLGGGAGTRALLSRREAAGSSTR